MQLKDKYFLWIGGLLYITFRLLWNNVEAGGVDFALYIITPLLAIVTIRSGHNARKNSQKIDQLTRAEAIE